MNKLIFAPVVAAFGLAACAEQADDATLETEDMRDVMPEQPLPTDPAAPGATLPDADTAGDRMAPDGTMQEGLKDDTMTPEDKPLPDQPVDQ